MTVVYPAIFHQEDDSYWVEFPDLPGCQTYADSVPEALSNAEEALSAYCAVLLEEGKSLSSPSDIKELSVPADAFATLVSASPISSARSVKKTLTVPYWLSVQAERAHAPYSAILQEGLEKYLGLS